MSGAYFEYMHKFLMDPGHRWETRFRDDLTLKSAKLIVAGLINGLFGTDSDVITVEPLRVEGIAGIDSVKGAIGVEVSSKVMPPQWNIWIHLPEPDVLFSQVIVKFLHNF